MKITGQIEQIFAQAVALDQSGGLKNSIYAKGKEIYIINYDHTVLMRFRLRGSETEFSHPISFKANDYDSNDFEEVDGKVVFSSSNEGYERKKICGKAEHSHEEIQELFKSYLTTPGEKVTVTIGKSVLTLLADDLSHIEFFGKKGNPLKMIQRNIYSGGIIEISEKNDGIFSSNLPESFSPVGLRTNDFVSLFAFQDHLKFDFGMNENDSFVVVKSIDKNKRDMAVIVSGCLYDELIEIKQSKI